MTNMEETLSRIRQQLPKMRAVATSPEAERVRTVAAISAWCPAEHVDHIAKVTNSILRKLANPDPPRLARGIRLTGRIILMLGRIPRGRGRSPEQLRGTRTSEADLLAVLGELEGHLERVDVRTLSKLQFPIVPHPRFGGLKPLQALRFAGIHNDHHLRIIEDIQRGH